MRPTNSQAGFGASAVFLLLCGAGGYMWLHSRKEPIGHHNVNDEWTPSAALPVDDKVAA